MSYLRKSINVFLLAALVLGMLLSVPEPAGAAQIFAEPIANDDSGAGFTTDEDTAFALADVLANDNDLDDDILSIESFDASATVGLVTLSGGVGSLDLSFGGTGRVSPGFVWGGAYGMVVQTDGKLVAVGNSSDSFALARYNPDGNLDAGFGSGGLVTTDIVAWSEHADDVVLQPDGKLVVVGTGFIDFMGDERIILARYNPDGSLDTSFDGDGWLMIDFGYSHESGHAVALQADGKIVVAGIGNADFALARFNTDGSPDTGFDGDGKLTTDFNDSNDEAWDVAILPDGCILAVGQAYIVGGSGYDFALARYNADGSLDTSFDVDGRMTTDFGSSNDYGTAVLLQPDGQILVTGYTRYNNQNDFALARYNADGSLDTSFDVDGRVTTDFGSDADNAYSAALQSDGRLILAGSTDATGDSTLALARYNPGGSLDLSFDGDGLLAGGAGVGRAVALQSDGKIVIAGMYDYDFVLERYLNGSGFQYDPNDQFEWLAEGEVFTDTFTYVVSDGTLTDTATVSVTVVGVNDAPVANDDSGIGFVTDEDTAFNLADVLANDSDPDGEPLSVDSLDTSATFGLVNWNGSEITYAPDGQFEWLVDGELFTDTFTYIVSDGTLTDVATVSIRVAGVDDALVAEDDAGPGYLTDEDTAFTLADVLANDSDPDGHPLSIAGLDTSDTTGMVTFTTVPGGVLDPTFDGDGRVITAFWGGSNEAHDLVVQPDGKLVVVGINNYDFALARYNPDGSLDTSFDGDGLLTTDFGQFDAAIALIQQSDGKLVAAGYAFNESSNYDFALARYNPDGSLDTSFDGDGLLTTDFSSGDDHSFALVLQSDGKLIVAGSSRNGINSDFALARYNPDGSLDTGFSSDGKLTTDFSGGDEEVRALALQTDGKIIAAGNVNVIFGGYTDFALARYNPDGSLDTSFDGDGLLTTDFSGFDDRIADLVLQPDGKLIVAGSTEDGTYANFALARYNPDGSLDASFGDNGLLTTDFFGNDDAVMALIIQSDGRLIAAGGASGGSNTDFALARYNPDGSLDASFDGDGRVVTDFFASNDYADALVAQPDGKLVACGWTGNYPEVDFALARYEAWGGDFNYDPNGQFEWLAEGEVTTDTFTYVVSNGTITDTAIVSITVMGVNDAPAAPDQAITTAEDTAFTGPLAASDVDGDPLTYSLDTAPSHGSVQVDAGGVFTYTPALNYNGIDSFTFAVSDGAASDDGQVTITITFVNDAPLVDAGLDQSVGEGQAVQFGGTITDPDLLSLHAVTIAWDFGDGATFTSALTPTHTYADNGAYTVTLTITDELGAVGVDTLLVSVVNAAPALDPIADQSVMAGQPLALTASFLDPGWLDTHAAVIDWGDGVTQTMPLAKGTQAFPFAHTYTEAGVYNATLTLTDDDGGHDEVNFTIVVTPSGYRIFLPVINK